MGTASGYAVPWEDCCVGHSGAWGLRARWIGHATSDALAEPRSSGSGTHRARETGQNAGTGRLRRRAACPLEGSNREESAMTC